MPSCTETAGSRIPNRGRQNSCRCANGSRLRVAGKGNAGTLGAPPVTCTSHACGTASALPSRRRQHPVKVPVTSRKQVSAPRSKCRPSTGKSAEIPPGTQNNQKFRLRERGVLNPQGARRSASSQCRSIIAGSSGSRALRPPVSRICRLQYPRGLEVAEALCAHA